MKLISIESDIPERGILASTGDTEIVVLKRGLSNSEKNSILNQLVKEQERQSGHEVIKI